MRQYVVASLAFAFAITASAQAKPVVERPDFKPPVERKLYVGADSHEAELVFEGKVELIATAKPTEKTALKHIQRQVEHLFGPMGENTKIKAVPKTDHKISNVKIAKGGDGFFEITYTYTGTIVVQNGVDTYDVALPTNPQTAFNSGIVNGMNNCTDHHYQSEGDFWYFWSPERRGCAMKKGVDYQVFEGKLNHKPNTKRTFPEYDRLLNAKNEVEITIFLGMDHESPEADPNTSGDVNAWNFQDIKRSLLDKEYKPLGKWSEKRLKSHLPTDIAVLPHIESFKKKVKGPKGEVTLKVQLFYGATAINESSTAFHHFLDESFKSHGVIMYGGHSGLGGHLSLTNIEQVSGLKLQPNKDIYQILFFNSCSSYPYYTDQFFDRKGGTKNLDIITNGLATYFSVMPRTMLDVVGAIEGYFAGKGRLSYQSLAKSMDSENLLGINGDEDNPKR